MESATGGRTSPLTLGITTAGSSGDQESIYWELKQYTLKVLAGVVDDDSWFGVIYTLDEGDSWEDESTWIKANPNLGVSVQLDDLRRKRSALQGHARGRGQLPHQELQRGRPHHRQTLARDRPRQRLRPVRRRRFLHPYAAPRPGLGPAGPRRLAGPAAGDHRKIPRPRLLGRRQPLQHQRLDQPVLRLPRRGQDRVRSVMFLLVPAGQRRGPHPRRPRPLPVLERRGLLDAHRGTERGLRLYPRGPPHRPRRLGLEHPRGGHRPQQRPLPNHQAGRGRRLQRPRDRSSSTSKPPAT